MPRRHPCLAPPPASLVYDSARSSVSDSSHCPSPGPAPPSPTRCSRLPASLYVAIEQIRNRRLGRCHREVPRASPLSRLPRASPPHRANRAPTSASPPPSLSSRCGGPGPWLARIAPHASPFSRMREKGPLPGNIRPKCMLFEIKMATSPPHASIPGRNRAIRDAWRANLAAKGPLSRRGARNHAWREDVASAARPFRGSGLRSGRTGFAPCGSGMRHAAWPNGPCAMRRGPGLLAACAPPVISLVPAAACAPCHLSRVHRRRLARVALRRPHRAHARRHPPRRPLRSG